MLVCSVAVANYNSTGRNRSPKDEKIFESGIEFMEVLQKKTMNDLEI